jgi:hypothetical protein
MSDDWPKPWSEIKDDPDMDGFVDMKTSWVDMGSIRMYADTVYINTHAGQEGANLNEWYPLDEYIYRKSNPETGHTFEFESWDSDDIADWQERVENERCDGCNESGAFLKGWVLGIFLTITTDVLLEVFVW